MSGRWITTLSVARPHRPLAEDGGGSLWDPGGMPRACVVLASTVPRWREQQNSTGIGGSPPPLLPAILQAFHLPQCGADGADGPANTESDPWV